MSCCGKSNGQQQRVYKQPPQNVNSNNLALQKQLQEQQRQQQLQQQAIRTVIEHSNNRTLIKTYR